MLKPTSSKVTFAFGLILGLVCGPLLLSVISGTEASAQFGHKRVGSGKAVMLSGPFKGDIAGTGPQFYVLYEDGTINKQEL